MTDDATATSEPAPPGAPAGRRPLVAVVVIVLLAVGVAGGVWYQTSRGDDETASAPTDVVASPVDEGMSFATGAGPIIDLYVDYQCSHCADLEMVIGGELINLVAAEEIELVIRPVKFLSRASGRGAAALYCAAEVGRAYDMHERLLADIAADFSPAGLTATAGTMGLDEVAFGACLEDQATSTWVNGVTATAQSDGIRGVPAVFVDGTRLSDAELASGVAFRNAVLGDGA